MNSHDVQAGDIIFDRNGVEQRVSRVSQVYEQDAPVCNLMIEEHQNYSVGHLGILVHNTSICGREISQIMDDIGAITDVAKRQEALEYILKNAENVPRQHLDELVDAFRARFGSVTLSEAAQQALNIAPKIKVAQMAEFFSEFEFGRQLQPASQATPIRVQGQTVYKASANVGEFVKKRNYFYLDNLHKDHLEVFDKAGRVKAVLNLDGTLNIPKTQQVLGKRKISI